MDNELYQLLKKLEEETKLLKVDLSKQEIQEIMKENLILRDKVKKLSAENEELRVRLDESAAERADIKNGLRNILLSVNGEDKSREEAEESVDVSALEFDEYSAEKRHESLRAILRENAGIYMQEGFYNDTIRKQQ